MLNQRHQSNRVSSVTSLGKLQLHGWSVWCVAKRGVDFVMIIILIQVQPAMYEEGVEGSSDGDGGARWVTGAPPAATQALWL